MIRNRIASLALVAAMAFALTAGFTGRASAQQGNAGGAAGLVAALVQINADDVDVVEVNVVDSFNNLTALNNILNNSPILSNNEIDVTVGDITVLQDFLNNNDIDVTLTDFLNNLDINIDDVVGVALLETGDLVIFV